MVDDYSVEQAEIQRSSRELEEEKRASREASVRAIRNMVRAVQLALEGGRLHGMPNIANQSTHPYRAARMRTKHYDEPLGYPPLGRERTPWKLCLNDQGRLVFACQDRNGSVFEEPVADEDLRAEDAELVAETLAVTLRDHLEATHKRSHRYKKMREISERINRALSEG